MISSTNLTLPLLKFKAVPTYACTLLSKQALMAVKTKGLKALAIIRADVITNLAPNRMPKEPHPHNCIKMDNKLSDQKSKDQAQLDLAEALDLIG